jgi:hypothetical protein
MDTLLPTVDMPLPGGYAFMDMFLPTDHCVLLCVGHETRDQYLLFIIYHIFYELQYPRQ